MVGIPENTPDANLEAKVTIEADGRTLLYAVQSRGRASPRGSVCDVKGVKTLRLIVEADFPVNGNRVIFARGRGSEVMCRFPPFKTDSQSDVPS